MKNLINYLDDYLDDKIYESVKTSKIKNIKHIKEDNYFNNSKRKKVKK